MTSDAAFKSTKDYRLRRALDILSRRDQIQRFGENSYWVKSQNSRMIYRVVESPKLTYSCDCKDYSKTHLDCKHILAVKILFKLVPLKSVISSP